MSVTNHNFKLNQIVYHEQVYNHREPLKIVGIREKELELEGDYSGGTHSVKQKEWLPIEGVSTIFDFKYKKESKHFALNVDPSNTSKQEVAELREIVLKLTSDINIKY